MDLIRNKIVMTALCSRALIWALSVVCNALIPDHKSDGFVWVVPAEAKLQPTRGDVLLGFLLDGLTRWDGQYFLHVANNGYTYESTLAFFPLQPTLVRLLAELIYWLQVDYGLISFYSTLKVSGALVSAGFFVLAALQLHQLSRKVLKDEYMAYRAVLYFCLNPASIFFSATYSESLHAFLSFGIMCKADRGFSFQLGLLLALSSATRSNGLINVAFVMYKAVNMLLCEWSLHQQLRALGQADLSTTVANVMGDIVMPSLFCLLVSLLPFCLFQWFGYVHFCSLTRPKLSYSQNILDYAVNQSLKLPLQRPSPWCFSYLPISYSYVQAHYWNVGFLKYFQLKQLPNFMLALPILVLVTRITFNFVAHHRKHCLSLGLDCKGYSDPAACGHMYTRRTLPKLAFVYVVHICALGLFALLFMHVQVATRFLLSSSPVVYWWAAIISAPDDKKPLPLMDLRLEHCAYKVETKANLESSVDCLLFKERSMLQRNTEAIWLQNYFILYAFLGTLLFSNHLPWT